MRYILSILFMFASMTANAETDCKLHPLYCTVIKLQPKVDKTWAMKLSNFLKKYSAQYGTDPYRSLAIAMRESSLQDIDRVTTVLVQDRKCDDTFVCIDAPRVVQGITDIGVFQFHVLTIQSEGIDAGRLKTDLEYAVRTHVKLLKAKMEMCADLGKEAWSCYHSNTPKHRIQYVKDVEPFYKGANSVSHLPSLAEE